MTQLVKARSIGWPRSSSLLNGERVSSFLRQLFNEVSLIPLPSPVVRDSCLSFLSSQEKIDQPLLDETRSLSL